MIDERREAQAAEYVLGALPPEELREFEQTLLSNLELQLLVNELRASAEMLPFALPVVTPPAALKEKVLAAIGGSAVAGGVVRESAVFPAWLPWALAACFAVLCITLLGLGSTAKRESAELSQKLEEARQAQAELQRENEILQASAAAASSNESVRVAVLEKQLTQKTQETKKQMAEARKEAEQAQAEIIRAQRQLNFIQGQLGQTAKDLDRARGLPEGTTLNQGNRLNNLRVGLLKPTIDGPPTATGTSVWEIHEQKGLLLIDNLPALPPDRDYQLWLFDPKFLAPVSGGIFSTSDTGTARLEYRAAGLIETAERFGISIERKGGVNTPERKMVMISN